MTLIRCKLIVLMCFMAMHLAYGQRPSFAGSRPADGLNQKDKYHISTLTTSADIANRFGSDNAASVPVATQLPFGQTQKPPRGTIVFPESNYVPIQNPNNAINNNNINNVNFEDRFGSGSEVNAVSGGSASSSAAASTPRPYIPLDAQGDQQLIDKLNSLPIDHRPFWFINAQAIEAQRNGTTTNFANAQGSSGSFAG